jgi:hypothetical protein
VDKGSESLFKAVAIAGADNEVREREREGAPIKVSAEQKR